MKNNNILIIGNYGNGNIGDETLLKIFILGLLKTEKDIKIAIPTRNPKFIDMYHADISNHINSFYLYDIKNLVRHIFNSQTVAIAGGGIWSGYTGRLAKLIPIFLIISKILGKKIIIKSIGLYNTATEIEKILVNLSFLLVDQCSVRDIESFNNIWKMNNKIKLEKDLALELPDILKDNELYQKYENVFENIPEYDIFKHIKCRYKYVVGISIKPLKDKNKTKELENIIPNFINIVNSKYENKIHFVFFPFSEHDKISTSNVISKVKFKDNITIMRHTDPIIWYLFIKKFIDIFIGIRFHSIIFAYINDKPFLAIPYENKVWNFMRSIQSENILTLENINEKYLVSFIESNVRLG